MSEILFKRKVGLRLLTSEVDFGEVPVGLDLSNLRIKFRVEQSDLESPNNATIRIYNLSKERMDAITSSGLEYSTVILDAGYENSTQFGTIFKGGIKQFRRGREINTDSYLDILAADNDVGYDFPLVNKTLPGGSTPQDRIEAAVDAMGIKIGYMGETAGGILPRGKVLFGLAREIFRDEADTQKMTWSVQDGLLQMIPLTGFLPGEAVILNSMTGMIGIPEQTDEGIKVRSLMNPRLTVGGLVLINNNDINQVISSKSNAALTQRIGQLVYNSFSAISFPADVSADGKYQLFVVEHCGDTRGNDWYSDLTCLALDPSIDEVPAYG